MGFIVKLAKLLIRCSIYTAVIVAIILLIPNLPPYTEFKTVDLEPILPSEGPLAHNEALNNAKQLYKDKLEGPEAFQLFDGEVYTSLASGEIVKLSPGGHITFVTKIGQPCTSNLHPEVCGRPLGFEIDAKERKLYVADAYHGIWKVDLKTDKKQLLVSPHVEISGRKPMLFNALTLDKNGDFFWTDSCSEFPLKDGSYCTLIGPTGRLFHYNAAKNESKVLLDNIWFANGVALSPDRQFVVVSETASFRLLKHYIDGPKKGKTETFVAGLPGAPDNVRALPSGGGVLLALYTMSDAQHPLLPRTLAAAPLARKFAARLMRLVEIPFQFLNEQFPHFVFQTIVHKIGHFESMGFILPPLSGLVQIDWNGNIVASYQNRDKSIASISDAIVYNDMLYLGSPHGRFVSAVPAPEALKKAFSVTEKVSPAAKETPKAKVEAKPVKEQKATETPAQKVEKPVVKPVEQAKPVPVKQTPPPPAKPADPPKPAPVKVEKPVQPKVEKPIEKPAPAKVEKPVEKPAPVKVDKPVEKPAPVKVEKPAPVKVEKPVQPKVEKPIEKPTPVKVAHAKVDKPAQAKEDKPAQPKVEKPAGTIKPKPAEPKPEAKPAETKTKEKTVPKAEQKKKEPKKEADPIPEVNNKAAPPHIPIEEEIPSDTVKPNKETLKVIKKDGPAEIPNPKI